MENITDDNQLELWPIKFAALGETIPKGARKLFIGYKYVPNTFSLNSVVGVYYVEEQ